MIVVSVKLISAITGEETELARMNIINEGTGTPDAGNYRCLTLRGRSKSELDKQRIVRSGKVTHHPKRKLHVWYLVAKALDSVGYAKPPSKSSDS